MITVKFKKLHIDAVFPEYKTPGAAGADLRSIEDVEIPSSQWRLIKLGFAMALPQGYEAQVRPRSGLAMQHGVTVLNSPGTVDCDYRGEMKVMLVNHGPNTFYVNKGDRIAQMVVSSVVDGLNLMPQTVQTLDATARGTGGFGSTGKD